MQDLALDCFEDDGSVSEMKAMVNAAVTRVHEKSDLSDSRNEADSPVLKAPPLE